MLLLMMFSIVDTLFQKVCLCLSGFNSILTSVMQGQVFMQIFGRRFLPLSKSLLKSLGQ